MKIDQLFLPPQADICWASREIEDGSQAHLLLVFADRPLIETNEWMGKLQRLYPLAIIVSCTTAGDILDMEVSDNRIVMTAIQLERTQVKFFLRNNADILDSYQTSQSLAKLIPTDGLQHVFLLSDGQQVNGSELIKAFNAMMPPGVFVSGGLAGDATRFEQTLVGMNEDIAKGNIVAIAFYGEALRVGHGSMGGWDPFGPERKITRSERNVLYELDGENALQLYKTYLGEKASQLPGSALLFPLRILIEGQTYPVVRTILSINEEEQSMLFAGDMPVGAKAQLMKANFDKLIHGASLAAEQTIEHSAVQEPELAVLVSCIGRKLVLGQRIEEELEVVREVLGEKVVLAGFYSYGELCPTLNNQFSDLHNQTMTITTFSEI
jgi:hypothetical protein